MSSRLIDQDKLLKLSFEKTPLATLIIDAESHIILKANKMATKFYGFDLEGKHVDRINYYPEKAYLALRQKLLNKKISVIQTKHINHQKKIIDVECHVHVFSLKGRKIFYSLVRDISEEMKYKEKKEKMAKNETVSNISTNTSVTPEEYYNYFIQANVKITKTTRFELNSSPDKYGYIKELYKKVINIQNIDATLMPSYINN